MRIYSNLSNPNTGKRTHRPFLTTGATVEGVWKVANWFEREVYDLFGVIFEGHSDLRRIMLPEDWIGYPLRKDYVEQEEYDGISTQRAPLVEKLLR
jgi:NADH-quinone oxidoreductase subunit C